MMNSADNQEPAVRVVNCAYTAIPEVQLLSNGRYHVMATNAGGGYSRRRDLAVTPNSRRNWRPPVRQGLRNHRRRFSTGCVARAVRCSPPTRSARNLHPPEYAHSPGSIAGTAPGLNLLPAAHAPDKPTTGKLGPPAPLRLFLHEFPVPLPALNRTASEQFQNIRAILPVGSTSAHQHAVPAVAVSIQCSRITT
jgi:hypothetical protein